MPEFGSVIDEIIRDAIASGDFSNLRGEGKPLKIDDPHTPEHLQMAHKILRDNDMAPDWIMESSELDTLRETILNGLKRAATAYRAARGEAGAESRWSYARRLFTEASAGYNRRILSYNLKVPQGVRHKASIDTVREIQRALEA